MKKAHRQRQGLPGLPGYGLYCLLFGLALSQSNSAETIQIPIGQQQGSVESIIVPTRGSSQDAVLQRFGVPRERTAATGQPPISRWDYESFVVYFEYQHVVHAVVTHSPKYPTKAD